MQRTKALARLEAKLVTVLSGCREFSGGRNPEGYGWFWFEGRPRGAHRVMWILHNGEPPPETPLVLHSCDNPPCCELTHLWLGTDKDNSQDRERKGRNGLYLHPERSPFKLYADRIPHPSGDDSPTAKLTLAKAEIIRARYADGERGYVLAEEFGVSPATISSVVNRTRWND